MARCITPKPTRLLTRTNTKTSGAYMNTIPQCIGIIMDGNRRWARARDLPTLEGHTRGYGKLQEISEWTRDAGIHTLIVYALSTENWKRTPEEVSYLMDLFRTILKEEVKKLQKENVQVRFVGDLSRFSDDIQKSIKETHDANDPSSAYTLGIAASYGGRAEILAAVNAAIEKGERNLSEASFSSLLWTHDLPDPDIIIRTGGEHRLSGFLTWQSVYSELFFTDTLWPDFSKEEFRAILDSYAKRERRHGK